MLDFFRNHKRLMMFVLILLVVPGLGFVGIQGFRGFFDESANVASVNGRKITRLEYDDVMRRQIDQARQILGAQFDLKMVDTPERRRAILDSLIQQRLLADQARQDHLTASDDAIRRALYADPVIATLRRPDGSMDLERYRKILAMQGMTPEQYDERVRYSLSIEQIPENIQASAFTPKSLAQNLMNIAGQRRVVQSLWFNTSDFIAKVKPTDAELTAYYEKHRDSFATPATATIQYVVLSPAALAAASAPTDADLKKYYAENIARYKTTPQIRASLILISAPQSANADIKAKAKQKADALLAQLKAHPDQFAAIAKQNSQDPLSAAKGGDLGYFGPNMMAGGAAFDDAAFKLKKGEISGVVTTDIGYLILKATDVKPVATKPFNAVKAQITQDLTKQRSEKAFSDAADGFSSIVYEQAKSLQPAADKYKLTIQKAVVTPKPNATLPGNSPLNNPKFLSAVFADDATKAKNNTQAIDVGTNTLISAHVVSYKPATVPALNAIKPQVLKKVIAEQAANMARQAGEKKLAELLKSKSTAGFSAQQTVTRSNAQGMLPAALSVVFKVNAQALPTYAGVNIADKGYAIYRVNAVLPSDATDPQRVTSAQQQIAQTNAQVEMEAYVDLLRSRSKVKLYGNLEDASKNNTD